MLYFWELKNLISWAKLPESATVLAESKHHLQIHIGVLTSGLDVTYAEFWSFLLLKAFRICDVSIDFVFWQNSKSVVLKDMFGSINLDVPSTEAIVMFSK